MAVQTNSNPQSAPDAQHKPLMSEPDEVGTSSGLQTDPQPQPQGSWISAINQLTKPRITVMVLFTAALGYAMAVRKVSDIEDQQFWLSPDTWERFFYMLTGTGLSCMAAGIFNQIIEKKSDGRMPRTAMRPLPTGKVSSVAAFVIASIMTGAGLWFLAFGNNFTTAALSAITIISYALIYTPLKSRTHISTIIGAFPGAIPPVMGFVAFSPNDLFSVEPMLLFAMLFLWQLPHFLAIAWLYKDDYAKAGLPMLPVIDDDYQATARQILLCSMILVPLTTLPVLFGMAGIVYLMGSLIISMLVLYTAVKLYFNRTRPNARVLFFALLAYLPLVFGLMFLDQK